LGSVGVIVSTILIKWTGWSGFDPLASIFIALLIVASVVPLVIDSGRILCLDVGEGKEKEIREALAEVSPHSKVVSLQAAFFGRRLIQLRLSPILASMRGRASRVYPYPPSALGIGVRSLKTFISARSKTRSDDICQCFKSRQQGRKSAQRKDKWAKRISDTSRRE
jgi:hypothetical protein